MSAKLRKKRRKAYRGQDASAARPTITRISAANRHAVSQWWFEKKRVAKPILIAGAAAAGGAVLLIELVRIFTGGGA